MSKTNEREWESKARNKLTGGNGYLIDNPQEREEEIVAMMRQLELDTIARYLETLMELECYSTDKVSTFRDKDLMWVKRRDIATAITSLGK